MTLIRPSLDYTAKDFDALTARLFNIIPSAFPEWTDDQIANFGNLLVEMFAFVGDVLTYYQDNQAAESRWSTAILRRSLLSMAKLIDYKPTGASAAQATLTVQLAAPPLAPVTFAIGDEFSTADTSAPVVFQALTNVVIPAGANPPVAAVVVENSKRQQDSYLSLGTPNQSFVLGNTPYVDNSLAVVADNGAYTRVDDFFSSTAVDRHFRADVDESARVHVTFGDGQSGAIPVGTVLFSYKYGGGAAGNVGSGTIVKPVAAYTDALGNQVTVKVINVARAGGGADIETVEAIREGAPRQLRLLTRTVCREDYEIAAGKVPGVSRALMLTADEKPTILENRGNLYILPAGGGAATQVLMNAVTAMITTTYPKTITFKPTVMAAQYFPIDISTKIHVARGANAAVVAAAVKKGLADFFAISSADGSRNNAIDFGYYMDGAIAWSDVFNVVRDTRGVRKVDDGLGNLVLNGESDDLPVPLERFPLLQRVTVIDAATGAAL